MTRPILITLLILIILLFTTEVNGQNLVFHNTKSKRSFTMQTGGKYTLKTMDDKTFKGIVTIVDLNTIKINSLGAGEINVEVKNLKSFTERRHIWYIGAWASFIKVNKKIKVMVQK